MVASEAREGVEERKEETKAADRRRQVERDKQTICYTLAKWPDGETKTTIRDTAGLHTRRFTPAFAELLVDGDVVACSIIKGNRKTPIEAYKLANEQ